MTSGLVVSKMDGSNPSPCYGAAAAAAVVVVFRRHPGAVLVAAMLSITAIGCSADGLPPRTTLDEPQHIAFRCVRETDARQTGLRLDGCGCIERHVEENGTVTAHVLGRVQCTCTQLNMPDPNDEDEYLEYLVGADAVEYVKADCTPIEDKGCVIDWRCTRRLVELSDGRDWVPASEQDLDPEEQAETKACPDPPPKPRAVECVPQRGQVRAYVASTGRGEVAVLNVGDDKEILDRDPTIPGSTAIFVDDVISDIGADPDGRFVYTIHSSSGRIALITDDRSAFPTAIIELASHPLLKTVVSPSPFAPATVEQLSRPREAFISAPTESAILRIDLDQLEALANKSDGGPIDSQTASVAIVEHIAVKTSTLPNGPDAPPARPGAMAVDDAGQTLYVAHLEAPLVTAISLADSSHQRTIRIGKGPCTDGYLTDVVDPWQARTCSDGLDNDGDLKIDGADSDCAHGGIWEGLVDVVDEAGNVTRQVPECPQQRDPETLGSECSDGNDNDDDGLADRDDPDCLNEADNAEHGRELMSDPSCDNGTDDDGDGLIDAEDPGCHDPDAAKRYEFERNPECDNGEDDDHDGHIDYSGGDLDCYAASDRNEGGSQVQLGPSALAYVEVDLGDGPQRFLYVVDRASNDLFAIDVSNVLTAEIPVPARRIRLGDDTQGIAARRAPDSASLLVIGVDNGLRIVNITAPVPLVDEEGRQVYARLGAVTVPDDQNPDVGVLKSGVVGYYVVEDGIAWRVPDLERDDKYLGIVHGTDDGRLLLDSPPKVVRSNVGAPVPLPDEDTPDPRMPVLDPTIKANAELDRGVSDPQVFRAGAQRILHDQINVYVRAFARTNQIENEPQLDYGGTKVTRDASRHPAFCVLTADDIPGDLDTDPQDPPGQTTGRCTPVGLMLDGLNEEILDMRARTAHRVAEHDAVVVLEEDPREISAGTYTLEYEGTLPSSSSRSGQYGHASSDDEGDFRWTLLDYDRDFCATGVEPGDVVLIERLVPESDEETDIDARDLLCADWWADTVVSPLRYRVVGDVFTHKLELEKEPREFYMAQLPSDLHTTLPNIPKAPIEPPPRECASEFITYSVRAANNQWLLTGPHNRYRHPWVNRNGRCEKSARYVREKRWSRAVLGQVFENEWFRFKLGYLGQTESETGPPSDGVSPGRLPNLVRSTFDSAAVASDSQVERARFTFQVRVGAGHRYTPGVSALPRSMSWLPVDDSLYIVDSAHGTVIEVGAFDVYEGNPVILRQFN